MAYRARLPAEFDLADLTHGERELARWAALSFGQKLRIATYLARRLARLTRDEARRAFHIAWWEAGVYARAARAYVAQLWRALGEASWRTLERAFDEVLDAAGAHVPRWAVIAAAYLALISLPTLFAAGVDARVGPVRAQAAIARTVAPSPCVWTDGQIWIEVRSGFVRPRDHGYLELRQALCGY